MKRLISLVLCFIMLAITLCSCGNPYENDFTFEKCNIQAYKHDNFENNNLIIIQLSSLFNAWNISLVTASFDYWGAMKASDITHESNSIKKLCNYFDSDLNFKVIENFEIPSNTMGAKLKIHYINGEIIEVFYSDNELYIWTSDYQYVSREANCIDGEGLIDYILSIRR